MSADTNGNSSSTQSTVIGGHYGVRKKIGEGSFGIVFEDPSPLSPTSMYKILPDLAPYPRRQPAQLSERGHQVCGRRSSVATAQPLTHSNLAIWQLYRSREGQMRLNLTTSIGRIGCWLVAVFSLFIAFAAWHNVALTS
jgi:hypothetical protein